MKIAVFPGSFDPVTLGHMDIIERASRLFDRVYLCAMTNADKHPLFTPGQRLAMLAASVGHLGNVTAELYTGLLADYARERGAQFLVKGVRNGTDFDLEYGMAQINRSIDPALDTVLLPANSACQHVSSTMVREMIKYGQTLENCMPRSAAELVKGWERNGNE